MKTTQLIAKQVRDVYTDGNWSWATLREKIADVTWQEATTKIYGLNTIAALVYHMNYYTHEVANALEGQEFTASDKFAFLHPPIKSKEDWESMLTQVFADGERLAKQIELLNDNILNEYFQQEKYGNHFRNFCGIIEHFHYHLGQIVIIKKILDAQKENKI